MTDERLVFLNGELASETYARVELGSPMWVSGRSLFETLLVYPTGKWGLYRERDHVLRLLRAADSLGWKGLPQEQLLIDWLINAAGAFRKHFDGPGRLRMTVAWIDGENDPKTYVTVVPYVQSSNPLRVVTTAIGLPSFGSVLVPKSGNRVIYGLAEMAAHEQGADEALLLGTDGLPMEGAKSNLFVVREKEVLTPPLDQGVLGGITRERLFRLSDRVPFRLREAIPTANWFNEASGYFMTNALWGVRPVGWIDGRPVDPHLPATLAFKKAYDQDVRDYLRTGNNRMKLL